MIGDSLADKSVEQMNLEWESAKPYHGMFPPEQMDLFQEEMWDNRPGMITRIPKPKRLLSLLTSSQRKEYPIVTGCLHYFPDALTMVSHASYLATKKHNVGQEMHWARGKSVDHEDCLGRHTIECGIDDDGIEHATNRAWRALAALQLLLEEKHGLSLPKGARRSAE